MQLPESDYKSCPKYADAHDHDAGMRRCVASGPLRDGDSCACTVPSGVVLRAWASVQHTGGSGPRFFRFWWEGELWLSFGLEDGDVRGVYCPEHTAERDDRASAGPAPRRGGSREFALAA